MPVLESNESIGWKGIEGNTSGHPGYVTIPAGIPTFVSETDWEVGRKLEEIRRRLATNVMRISSKLTAAIAMAIVPSAEILRLADAEAGKAPELEPAPPPVDDAAIERIVATSQRLAAALADVPAALSSAEQPADPKADAPSVPAVDLPAVEAPASSEPVADEKPVAAADASASVVPVPTGPKPRRRGR